MNRDKDYISTILIIVAAAFSLYVIVKNFFTKTSTGDMQAALPLIIPVLALLIPIAIVIFTIIFREIAYRKLVADGVKSFGFIKKVTETGNYKRKMPEIKLELEVIDEDGNKFLGEVVTIIHPSELKVLKKGEPVPIIYNINNKNNISVDRKPDVFNLKEKINQYNEYNKMNRS